MSYEDLQPTNPDPTSESGLDAFTSTRRNILAVRDAALVGALSGWQLAISGGTAARPTTWTYSRGTERLRVTMAWGTSGGNDGKPVDLDYDYSPDSGSTWETIGATTLQYDSQGHLTGASGVAPALAAQWLLGAHQQIRDVKAELDSHLSNSDAHPGYVKDSELASHANTAAGVHGVPSGKSTWHTGNLVFSYNASTETLDIQTS